MINQKERLQLIANAVANADNKVNAKFTDLLEEIKADKIAEDLVLEHGLLEATDRDVEDEFVSLDAVESDKDAIDENDEEQVDMDCVSSSFADLFDTIED